MRRLVAYVFVSCFSLLIAASVLSSSAFQVVTPSEADWKWLSENFQSVLARVFALQKDNEVFVSYRSYESLQVGNPEYSFSISERGGEGKVNLFARIRMPDGEPIGRQLLAFHREFPGRPIEEAEKKLKFKDWELTEQQCPALRIAVQKLSLARFGWEFDKIIMDPTVHEFYVHSYTGNLVATIFDDENPLVRWALETRSALETCAGENHPPSKSAGERKE